MGFDLYGENPTITKGTIKPIEPNEKYNSKDESWDLFFEQKREYESANIGVYFRASVWSWRPIWAMVQELCDDILSKEEIKQGSYNDGFLINAMKAELIGQRLISQKDYLKEFCEKQKTEFALKREFNEKLSESATKYLEIMSKLNPELDIQIPLDLKKIKNSRAFQIWQMLGSQFEGIQYGETAYSLDYEHIMQFAEFCTQSGGFRIH